MVNNQTKVGLFSLITVVIFVLGFYFLKGINLFTTKNKYYAVFEKIDGLYKSNPVVVNGFRIGSVSGMSIDQKSGKITVEITAEDDFQIPDASMASIASTDLVGSKVINVTLKQSNKILGSGDTIKTFVQGDLISKIGDAIDPLVAKLGKTLNNLDSVLAGINGALGKQDPTSTVHKLNAVLDNVHSITLSLDATLKKGTLDRTLSNLAVITDTIGKNSAGIKRIIGNLADLTDTLKDANLAQTVKKAQMALSELNNLLYQVNNGDGTITHLIKDKKVYNDIDAAILHLDSLLADVKQHPFRYVNVSVFGGQKRDDKYKAKLAKEAEKKKAAGTKTN